MRQMDPQSAEFMLAALQRGGDVPAVSQLAGDGAKTVIADAFRFGFATMAVFAIISSILAWSIPLRRI
jgi:hypothetical protein